MLHLRRNRITEDALGMAASGASRARRRTARGLESAASVIDDTSSRKGRRRKPLLLAAVAGVAGWVAVKVFRSKGPQDDEATDDAEAEAKAAPAKAPAKAAPAKEPVADEADPVGAKANARTGSNAAH